VAAKGKDLVEIQPQDFRLMQVDQEELRELIADNMGDGGIPDVWALTRIVVPTGGATFWTVGDEPVKTITGIIVHQREVRRYYEKSLDDGGEKGPPDCGSFDMVHGVGRPGGACAACPLAAWGSATKPGEEREQRGQACRTYRMLVMQFHDRLLPSVVMVPPTSLKELNRYLTDLTSEMRLYHRVITELSLVKEDRSGWATAIVKPRMVAEVPRDMHAEHVKPLADNYKAFFKAHGAQAAA